MSFFVQTPQGQLLMRIAEDILHLRDVIAQVDRQGRAILASTEADTMATRAGGPVGGGDGEKKEASQFRTFLLFKNCLGKLINRHRPKKMLFILSVIAIACGELLLVQNLQ